MHRLVLRLIPEYGEELDNHPRGDVSQLRRLLDPLQLYQLHDVHVLERIQKLLFFGIQHLLSQLTKALKDRGIPAPRAFSVIAPLRKVAESFEG